MRAPTRLLLVLVSVVALVAAACGDDDTTTTTEGATPADPSDASSDADEAVGAGATDEAEAADRPLVLVTTTILGDVTRSLVGDQAEVEVVMPIGADPHDFEASAQQAARMRDADLIVANGLTLEIGLEGALEGAEADGITVLHVAEMVDPLPFGDHDHDDDDHGHGDDDHGDDDHAH
ncbi:MAG TPA: zinc ABC transporter substrate-binding protein, partial [Acidimicrobiales bacterium]|nr:zinc ABC transporter substrate-binding protein [Acidimicrobiales bacterium]